MWVLQSLRNDGRLIQYYLDKRYPAQKPRWLPRIKLNDPEVWFNKIFYCINAEKYLGLTVPVSERQTISRTSK
jgi:hypothetical protein